MSAETGRRPGSQTSVHLPAALRDAILERARDAYPAEGCGLLIGRRESARVEIVLVPTARNMEGARERYSIDPLDHFAAEEEARARGLAVVGVWHSHPDQPALPSEVDRKRAWEGWSYVIVSVDRRGVRELRSWRLVDGQFVEESVSTV